MNIQIALYVGAGVDTDPMVHCEWIRDFICIDSQPESEFGIRKSRQLTSEGHNAFSRPGFIGELETAYRQVGLYETKHPANPSVKVYANHLKRVFYYPSTAIPEHHCIVKHAIKKIDTLIVAGHDPDSIILNYVTKRLDFIGFEGTSYEKDETPENHNSILNRLHNGTIQFYFKKFMYIHKNGVKMEFTLWEDFMIYYEEVTNYHPIVI